MEVLVAEGGLDEGPSRAEILAIHRVPVSKTLKLLQAAEPDASNVICIAYCPNEQMYVIKFRTSTGKTKCALAEFDD